MSEVENKNNPVQQSAENPANKTREELEGLDARNEAKSNMNEVIEREKYEQYRLIRFQKVSEDVFDVILDVPDEKLFAGQIPEEANEEITEYLAALNSIFPKSKAQDGVSVVSLSAYTMRKLYPKIAKLIEARLGGETYLDFVCDIANEEAKSRLIPKVVVRINGVTHMISQGKEKGGGGREM